MHLRSPPHRLDQSTKAIHPEMSDDSDSDSSFDSLVVFVLSLSVTHRPTGFSAACSCEYPRWCHLVSNREWVSDDLFEITQEEDSCCCKPKQPAVEWAWRAVVTCSEEHPERVSIKQKPVEEHDMQYLTIGIVVNAPYGCALLL